MKTENKQRLLRSLLCAVGFWVALAVTGCQTEIGGQMHPSSNYMQDDLQYHAPGPEFLLSKEAAAMKEFEAQRAQEKL